MSWLRAILTAAIAVGLAFVALVIVPDLVLSQINSIARGQRVALATGWYTVALVAMLWALRRLQDRHTV
jgi:uncharacterized membrane protein YqjE